MRISQDLFYTRLKDAFTASFPHREASGITCVVPALFEAGEDQGGCAVVIAEDDYRTLPSAAHAPNQSLFICLCSDDSSLPCINGCSTIAIIGESSPARVLNEVQRIFTLFNEWENGLKEILYSDGSFWDISDCTEAVLYDPYSVQDKDFEYVSYASLSEERGLVAEFVNTNNSYPLDYVNTLMSDDQYMANRGKPEPYIRQNSLGEVLDKNLFSEGKYIGRLILQRPRFDDEMLNYYCAIYVTLSFYIEKLYERHKGFARNISTINSLKRIMTECFEGESVDDASLSELVQDMGWHGDNQFLLIQMRATPRRENEMNTKYLITEMAHIWGNCIAFEYAGKLIILVNEGTLEPEDKTAFFQSLTIFLRDNLLAASISRSFDSLKASKTAFEQTEAAFAYGKKAMPMQWCYRFDDIIMDYLLDQCTGSFEAEEVCSTKVLKLRKYDEEKHAELCKTLRTYIACNYNAVATAKELCIHRTSFLNRLSRIREIADIHLDSFEEALYLHLSLALIEREPISGHSGGDTR